MRRGTHRSLGVRILIRAALLVVAVQPATPAEAARRFPAPLLTQFTGVSPLGYPASFCVADLNHDGIPDVVGPADLGGPDVLLGAGDGTLEFPQNVHALQTRPVVAAGDFDGDGAPDIVWAGAGGGGGVAYGDGSGRHWTLSNVFSDRGYAVVVGDFDGDGRYDFAAITSPDPYSPHFIKTCLSRPGRSFSIVTSPGDSVRGTIWAIRCADLNGDGYADIVLIQPGWNPQVVELLGRGDGTFSSHAVDQEDGLDPTGLSIADVTCDGLPDLVVARKWQLTIVPGLGDGTFGQTTNLLPAQNPYCYSVAVGDVTGDGVLDLVTSEVVSNGWGIAVRAGLGAGAYGPPVYTTLGPVAQPIELADMDGDERLDLIAMVKESKGILVALGDGVGGFGGHLEPIPVGSVYAPIGVADFNGDSIPDLSVRRPNSLGVALGDGVRSFTPMNSVGIPVGGSGGPVEVTDFNHDGHPDLVLLQQVIVSLMRGNGDGMLDGAINVAIPLNQGSAFVDVTGDSLPDIVYGTGNTLHALPGDGSGAFGPAIDSDLGYPVGRMVPGDLNGDGQTDLAISSVYYGPFATTAYLMVAIGHGDGTFVRGFLQSTIDAPQDLLVGDVNSDGRDDVLLRDWNCTSCPVDDVLNRINAWLQQPNGTLGARIDSPWPYDYAGNLRLHDVNGDGFPDILYRTTLGFGVAIGDGTGRFQFENGYGGTTSGCVPGDFDRDAQTDIVTVGSSGGAGFLVVYYGGDVLPPDVTLVHPASGTPLVVGYPTSIDWQASDDTGVSGIDLFVSRHGPLGPFIRIAAGLPNSGHEAWTVTGPLSDSAAFKVVARDGAGNVGRAVSSALLAISEETAVTAERSSSPGFGIASISPNPASEQLAVTFVLPHAQHVTLDLVDVGGREVARLLDADRPGGMSRAFWKPAGSRARPGLYLLKLATRDQRAIARVVLTR